MVFLCGEAAYGARREDPFRAVSDCGGLACARKRRTMAGAGDCLLFKYMP